MEYYLHSKKFEVLNTNVAVGEKISIHIYAEYLARGYYYPSPPSPEPFSYTRISVPVYLCWDSQCLKNNVSAYRGGGEDYYIDDYLYLVFNKEGTYTVSAYLPNEIDVDSTIVYKNYVGIGSANVTSKTTGVKIPTALMLLGAVASATMIAGIIMYNEFGKNKITSYTY